MTLPPRIYVDTSVFGGVFDDEFAAASEEFFNSVRAGALSLVTSEVVALELKPAPFHVQAVFKEFAGLVEVIPVDREVLQLRDAYLSAGVVAPRWRLDALHVALATISRCQVIVSWNFKHIVNFQKIPLYNKVNAENGYLPIAIHTPQEVVINGDENEDV